MKALAFAVLFAVCSALQAQDLSRPIVLAATPALQDPFYAGSVVIVAPLGGDQHIGFIINKATDLPLGKAFPDGGPAQSVQQPVYIGGPFQPQLIFALVQRTNSPDGKSLRLMPGVYACVEAETVEGIMKGDPAQARFVAGLVTWQEGELAAEIRARAWYVLPPDEHLLETPANQLWETLVHRATREVI
ncbi:MAG: YqgE/AlgH family protein [Betaproteobacteria bacterium]|nr:YqgE/AlgH family protein [Betaproteobacteria bacterium]